MKQHILVDKLTTMYPEILLKKHKDYYWAPSESTVYYDQKNTSREGVWALLHESGHALLGHTTYLSDFELLQLEVAAWEKAKEVAGELRKREDLGSWSLELGGATGKNREQRTAAASKISSLGIDEDHVQDCLDSYRIWLHKRSLCPDCSLSGAQIDPTTYTCIFCHKHWNVTLERFCRPYRRST